MALTNAERQARYRARLKAAAAGAAGDDGDGKALLVGSYRGAGVRLLERHGKNDPVRQEAIRRFLAQPEPTWLDLVGMVEEAGQEAVLLIYEQLALKSRGKSERRSRR